MGGSWVEDLVAEAQRAITLDTIDRARQTGSFSKIILATDSLPLAERVGGGVEIEIDPAPFHFGERLREIVQKYAIKRPVYIGGGSAALLPASDLALLAAQIAEAEDAVITNNLFSADLVAFTPGEAISRIDLPALDNPLAQLLRRQAGLQHIPMPRTAATQFDVDTPADLLVLKVHPSAGEHTKAYLDSLDLDVSRLQAAMRYFVDTEAEVLVAGRVGSYVWAHLESETACRVRLLSEERGMRADGREERGEVRSILAFYLQEVGLERFFGTIAQLGQAAFIDSRVIFNHLGLKLSAADRFLSDLGQSESIADPFAKAFTTAAREAPIPIVLGGHSLVAGGLWAIVDAAWRENDERLTG